MSECPAMDLDKVIFTEHAIEQFVSRSKRMGDGRVPKEPERTIRKLLAHASEDGAISSVGKVRRLIDNDFTEAHYFVNSGWRFVIVKEDNGFVVVTVERIN